MRLTELEPQFTRCDIRVEPSRRLKAGVDPYAFKYREWTDDDFEEVIGPRTYYINVDTLAEAQGLWFLCPVCYKTSDGPHHILIGFEDRGCPPGTFTRNQEGHDVRWHVSGTGYEDLTTQPSILLIGGCGWHGFITNGEVTS